MTASAVTRLLRYCSGCTHETEHLVSAHGGRASIPSIRWATVEPAARSTICTSCGQERPARLG
jgi:hypothetical protein